jgi:glycosyltransferase involved in cell wall biosynthesis
LPDPKVSVVISTYNRPQLLKRAVKSVLEQTYKNLEIIIVDDSPTNASKEVLEEFPSKNIRYLRRSQKKGVSSAKNLGIRIAVGDFIALLGDDDEWLPNKLELQARLFSKVEPETGVIHTNCFVEYSNGFCLKTDILRAGADIDERSLVELLEYNFIADSTALVKKECFEKVGYFDENLPYAEDWDFYIRLAKQFKIKYIPEPLAIVHWATSDGLGRNLRTRSHGHQLFLAKHWQEYKKHRRILARLLRQIGLDLNAIGKKRRGRIFLINALQIFPLDPRPVFNIIIEIFNNLRLIQILKSRKESKMLLIPNKLLAFLS